MNQDIAASERAPQSGWIAQVANYSLCVNSYKRIKTTGRTSKQA